MKTVCSFCNAVIHEGDSPDDPVSHGVCESCYRKILTKHGFNIRKFLDMLEAPVFLVDDDVNILAANSLAIATVKKPVAQISGNICGRVLDCINAFLQPGCGKTTFCPDCTIRSSVNETYATGHTVNRRPALLTHRTHDTEKMVQILVSTRKDGEIVLLRLEAA